MELLRALICFIQFRLFHKLSLGKQADDEISLRLQANQLHRYVICMVNLLNQGRKSTKLTLCLDASLLSQLHLGRHWKPYNTSLLTSSKVRFRPKFLEKEWIECSIDYFSPEAKDETCFRVPIGVHPLFWTWRHPEVQSRDKGAFFAGDAGNAYDEFEESKWGMPSRNTALEYLQQSGYDENVSLRIPTEKYLEHLQDHTFFIALSGVSMPLCHSLYEAVYFQCIPLVHTNMLEHVDSYLSKILRPYAWSSLAELAQFLQNSHKVDAHDLHCTRGKLKAYWDEKLNPVELTNRIQQAKKIYLCAEEKSVALFNVTSIA